MSALILNERIYAHRLVIMRLGRTEMHTLVDNWHNYDADDFNAIKQRLEQN